MMARPGPAGGEGGKVRRTAGTELAINTSLSSTRCAVRFECVLRRVSQEYQVLVNMRIKMQ